MYESTATHDTGKTSRSRTGAAVVAASVIVSVCAVIVAIAAVVVAVRFPGDSGEREADPSLSAAILAALQANASDVGAGAAPAPAPAEPGVPADEAPAEAAPAPIAPAPAASLPEPAAAPAPAAAPEPVAEAPAAPAAVAAPSGAELTAVLRSAVDPANPASVRQSYVERGSEAAGVLEQISGRAGQMLAVVNPTVVDPISVDGNTASGRLQVMFAGAAGPQTPLRLTFVNDGSGWKLSARSVCDVASFNGFSCPSGYAR
ncbi:hypothetical protein [Rhodococcus sp. NPDC003383]